MFVVEVWDGTKRKERKLERLVCWKTMKTHVNSPRNCGKPPNTHLIIRNIRCSRQGLQRPWDGVPRKLPTRQTPNKKPATYA